MSSIIFDPVDEIIELLQSDDRSIVDILPQIKSLSRVDFQRLLDTLSTEYHEHTPLIDDSEFDLLEEIFESLYHKNKKVGAKPSKTAKPSKKSELTLDLPLRPSGAKPLIVSLPIPMWGLAKHKDDHALGIYLKKYDDCEFTITDKLDGVSVYLEYSRPNGSPIITTHMYKRGDEKEGSDITYILSYLPYPELSLNEGEIFAVRAEIVMPLKTFNDKYASDVKNTRNMVAGLLNSKTLETSKIADLHIVAYHIYAPIEHELPQSKQLDILKSRGFRIPEFSIITSDNLTTENLTSLTNLRKSRSLYDIDGLCIAADIPLALPTHKEPEHVVAFKIQGETAKVKVEFVDWNVDKLGIWRPRIKFDSVILDGASLSWATANNARWVEQYGLGPGAIVLITRSGGVIAKVLDTLHRVEPQFPDSPYRWIENDEGENVHIALPEGTESDDQKIKKIVSFFEERNSEFLAVTTITKLYKGGLNTLYKLFESTWEDIAKIEGFQKKSAERIIENIKKAITKAPIHEIMAASGCFPGFGKKRLKLIVDNKQIIKDDIKLWNINKDDYEELRLGILSISSIGPKLADKFIEHLPDFKDWFNEHEKWINITDDVNDDFDKEISSDDLGLNKQVIVFSGTRPDMNLQRLIEKRGGRVSSAVSGKTTLVVVKSLEAKISTKVQTAIDKGVNVLSFESFIEQYKLTDYS